MAEGQQGNALSATFPAPPPFYKHFTEANLEKLEALSRGQVESENAIETLKNVTETLRITDLPPELRYLVPPPPPASGKFRVFGESYDLLNTIISLPDQGIEQLYPSASTTLDERPSPIAPNHADKLIHISRSILLNFLELVDVLAKDPSQYGQKLEDLTKLFYNAHHLLNEYRPHQARETLIELMRGRIDVMQEDIKSVGEMEGRVDEMLRGLGESDEREMTVPDREAQRKTKEQDRRIAEASLSWSALQAIEL